MSGYKDNSQGFEFNYKIPKFKKRKIEKKTKISAVKKFDENDAIQQIKENLNRLQSLHKKLEELLTGAIDE